jgi:hypothetical protein
MQYYQFDTEEIAISAEQWICDKACELGVGFNKNPEDITKRYARPREHEGKWIFVRISPEVRDGLPQSDIDEFLNTFSPNIITI